MQEDGVNTTDTALPELKAAAAAEASGLHRGRTFPYVHQGDLYCFGLAERLRPPAIPPGESAIVALAALETGITLGVAAGNRGHLFYFHPGFGIAHVGLLGERPVSGGAMLSVGGNLVVGGWWGEEGGGLFRHDATTEAGQGIEQFRGAAAPIEAIPLPDEGDGIVALAGPGQSGTVFGLCRPSGTLVAIEPAAGQARAVARIEAAAPVLGVLPWGDVVGAHAEGQLWQYSPFMGLSALDAFAPCQMGKRYVAGVQSLVVTAGGDVYGGTSTDGYLFRYGPHTDEVVNLGKPNRQSHIRALVEGHDGLLYGVVEEPGGMAHLFNFDPSTSGFTDLGILGAAFPEHWSAHSVGSMSVGPHGQIFLGETDQISHLFVYYPPMPRRVTSDQ